MESSSSRYPHMYVDVLPEKERLVIAKVLSVGEDISELELLEYGGHIAMMTHGQLTTKRIRSIRAVIQVGKEMILKVYNVDGTNVDLSNRGIESKEAAQFRKAHQEANALFQLCSYFAPTIHKEWKDLYDKMILPIYDRLGETNVRECDGTSRHSDSSDLSLSDDDENELDEELRDQLKNEITADRPETPYQLLYKLAYDRTAGTSAKTALRSYLAEFVEASFLNDKELDEFIGAIQNRVYPSPIFEISGLVSIISYQGDAILRIKESLKYALAQAHPDVELKISYVSSPHYLVKVTANARHQNPKEHLELAFENVRKKFGMLCILVNAPNETRHGQFIVKKVFPQKHPKKVPKKFFVKNK
jgi:translation initiation factor 2 alpha subunit (eIF-2alpha)